MKLLNQETGQNNRTEMERPRISELTTTCIEKLSETVNKFSNN